MLASTAIAGPTITATLPAMAAPAVNIQREMTDPAPTVPPDSLAAIGLPEELEVDDLAARLYPVLADRFKAELRHDRDRAGRLTGL